MQNGALTECSPGQVRHGRCRSAYPPSPNWGLQDAQAHHGFLVSWGVFKRAVDARRNELFFRIRMWGRTQLVDALLETSKQGLSR